jgi:hypothetical protein
MDIEVTRRRPGVRGRTGLTLKVPVRRLFFAVGIMVDTGPMLKPLADIAPDPQQTFGPYVAICLAVVVVVAVVVVAVVLLRRANK